jgi:hypothetical protein
MKKRMLVDFNSAVTTFLHIGDPVVNPPAGTHLHQQRSGRDGGQFIMTLWRNWLTDSILSSLNLNDRQRRAITFARLEGRITNASYRVMIFADCRRRNS